MKIAYFDCQFGAAGNMLLGALLDAGVSQQQLLSGLSALALPKDSFEISISKTTKQSLSATYVDVKVKQQDEERHLSDILSIIEKSAIPKAAQTLASKIFTKLAIAEAKVHGIPVDHVHFHEVGAIDAIVDIVGFSIGYDLLKINTSYVSPLAIGSGSVEMEHGIFPIPGPATVNLLADSNAPTTNPHINFECLTPTGAAILTTIASSYGAMPPMQKIIGTGFGAGTKDTDTWPNVCRVILGESSDSKLSSKFSHDEVTVIEANLDDATPQLIAYAAEKLVNAGALDVTITPIIMKKGRSGQMLTVICSPSDRLKMTELLLSETPTLGVRYHLAQRSIATREWKEIDLDNGKVRIKLAKDLQGNLINAQPEYDDCVEYASKHGLALKEVMSKTLTKFQQIVPTVTK